MIEDCGNRMNEKYGAVVFDEWLIVSTGDADKILAHSSPRGDRLIEAFQNDAKIIHEELTSTNHPIGDFGFTHEGHGTRFDAFVVLGKNLFVLWNKIGETTSFITKNPRWTVAQTEFVRFTEIIRSNPVQYPG